jgi:hypothetical protein
VQVCGALEAKRMESKDLRFQITELKEQLTALNAASTIDQQFVHDEVNRVGAQMKAKLEAMAPYATRIATHFSHFPELRERLSAPIGTTRAFAPAPSRDLTVPKAGPNLSRRES